MDKIIFTKKHFNTVKNISWADMVTKISQEYQDKNYKIISEDSESTPTIVCHSNFYPETILSAYNEVKESFDVLDLHTYTSFSKDSLTFGRHKDTMDVLIVQAVGLVEYFFDDGSNYKLEPGDSIYIPKGIYHEPKIFGPRITLSFGL